MEKLEKLIHKLKVNEESLSVLELKTTYRKAYDRLLAEIQAEANKELRPVALNPPVCLSGAFVSQEDAAEMGSIFQRCCDSGSYRQKIWIALYKHYSVQEAASIAEELNRKFQAALEDLFQKRTCLYTTAANWNEQNPVIPKLYNSLVDKFWDEERRAWVDKEKPPGAALLIFANGEMKGVG